MFEQFSVRNFKPAPHLESYARSRLGWICEEIPRGAKISAQLERFGVGYRLRLEVASASGRFSDEALANDAMTSIDRLNLRIGEKLARWTGHPDSN